MIVEFDKSFLKSLEKNNDKMLLLRIEKVISRLEKSSSITERTNIKKLSGFKGYYRYRLGAYWIGGIELISDNIIRLILVEHRKYIHDSFP